MSSLRDRLHDPEKEVRQHAARVLADLILALPKSSLKQHIRPLLPSMIANLGHNSLAVRKSILDCLKVYIKHTPTPNDDFLEIIRVNDETQEQVLNGILTFIPSLMRPEVLSMESVERAVDTLWNFSQQCVNEEICIKSLSKIRWKLGSETFNKVLHPDRIQPFKSLCDKYGLYEIPDEDYSSSTSDDKLILETEIQLDSGSSIKLQIHEESSDKEFEGRNPGILRVLDDDSDLDFYESTKDTPRTPRRVHFGGEIVKMRTPESDSTQTSDSEKKMRKSTSTPVQSFVKLKKNTDTSRKASVEVKKLKSKSLDNLTLPHPGMKNPKTTKIPLPKSSVPNSPSKEQNPKINKPRLHNSAPNLSRTSKIPKKANEKSKGNIKTTLKTESNVKQNDNKDVVLNSDEKLNQDSTIFTIKENMKMIELNIKNNIALQILFSNGNDVTNGKPETAVKITELPPDEELKTERKEDSTQTDNKLTNCPYNTVVKKETETCISKSQCSKVKDDDVMIKKSTAIVGLEKIETKSENQNSSTNIANVKTISAKSSNKSTEPSTTKKGKYLPKLHIPKNTEEKDESISPLVDEKFLLECVQQPRRYSRAEDILSPVPVHNEVQILHNLTRSPEHTRKNRSRPATATIRPQQLSRPGTATIQKTYESFRIFPEDAANNNSSQEIEKNGSKEEKPAVEEPRIEFPPEMTDVGAETNVTGGESIKIIEEYPVQGTSNGLKPQFSLPEIIAHLRVSIISIYTYRSNILGSSYIA